jgi:hypothetical protein
MSKAGTAEDQIRFTSAENDGQTSDGCSNNNPSNQPVDKSEKTATELDNETNIETSKVDNAVGSEQAINEPAAANSVPVDTDRSEKDQSDDSQPDNALKKTKTSASDKPYSVFTPWQKRFIILAASTGSFISPLTSNIYFPALPTIASDLHVSITQINLTITTYMVCTIS